jgi:hypothetical protein
VALHHERPNYTTNRKQGSRCVDRSTPEEYSRVRQRRHDETAKCLCLKAALVSPVSTPAYREVQVSVISARGQLAGFPSHCHMVRQLNMRANAAC